MAGVSRLGTPGGCGGKGGYFCSRTSTPWYLCLNLDRGQRGTDRSWGDRDPVRREGGGRGQEGGLLWRAWQQGSCQGTRLYDMSLLACSCLLGGGGLRVWGACHNFLPLPRPQLLPPLPPASPPLEPLQEDSLGSPVSSTLPQSQHSLNDGDCCFS